MKINCICNTDGTSLWSSEVRPTRVWKLAIFCIDDDYSGGELRAFFVRRSWDTMKHGLIYTDRQWMKDFKAHLLSLGLALPAIKEVSYSEQGMQGDDYVSMDVGGKFIKEFIRLGGKINSL